MPASSTNPTRPRGRPSSHRPLGKLSYRRLTVDIPEETHRRFKAEVALRGRTMADELARLMDEYATARATVPA